MSKEIMLNKKERLIKNTKQGTTNKDYELLAEKVQELIEHFEYIKDCKNKTWRERYCDYAVGIKKHNALRIENSKKYRKLLPEKVLEIYTSVGVAKENDSNFNIRFQGESIGDIKRNKSHKIVFRLDSTNVSKLGKRRYNAAQFKKDGKTLLDYFNIGEYIENEDKAFEVEIEDSKFKIVKDFFSNSEEIKRVYDKNVGETSNREHEYESKIMMDNENVITLCGSKFQMPTPLGASKVVTDGIVKYSGPQGNGCDILMKSGKALSVIELKDEEDTSADSTKKVKGSKKETPEMSIKQAICYAVFLGMLLNYRDNDIEYNEKCVKPWREIFGLTLEGKLPINAVICMPYASEYKTDFDGIVLKMDNFDITLRAILLDKDESTWRTAFDKLDV